MKRIPGVMILTLLLTVPAFAADLRIMDSSNVEVLVKDISIDYGGLLGTDKETEGIRVSQGEAFIIVKWATIESVTVTGRDPAAARITAEVATKDGKKANVMLVRKGRMKLVGKSDLGDYSIDLEKVKRITVVSAALTETKK